MTGYTVHTGSTEQFSDGWDHIFRDSSGKKAAARKTKGSGDPTGKGNKSKSSRAKRKKS